MPKAPPESDDARERALTSLDAKLNAFEAQRAPKASPLGGTEGMGEGYRLLAGLIGGVLGGIGLGWTFDYFAHTGHIGLICGLLIGMVLSIVGVVAAASRMSAQAAAKMGPVPSAPPAPGDDDEDD
jgi:ATP synthase protein I